MLLNIARAGLRPNLNTEGFKEILVRSFHLQPPFGMLKCRHATPSLSFETFPEVSPRPGAGHGAQTNFYSKVQLTLAAPLKQLKHP